MEPTEETAGRPRSSASRPRRAFAAAAVAFALVGAACGGASGAADDDKVASVRSTTTVAGKEKDRDKTGGKDAHEARLAYARCMRENGVDIPDPDPNGLIQMGPGGAGTIGGDDEKTKAANKACEHHLRDGLPPMSAEDEQRMRDELLAFARCMREQGVDMPDPSAPGSNEGGGGFTVDMPEPGSQEDTKFKEAQKKCDHLLRKPGAGGDGAGKGGGRDAA